jgi:hypothetical protein
MNPSNSQFDQGSPTRKRFLATKDAFEPPTSEHATGIPEVQAIGRSYIVHPIDDAEIKRNLFKFEVAPDRSFKNSFSSRSMIEGSLVIVGQVRPGAAPQKGDG